MQGNLPIYQDVRQKMELAPMELVKLCRDRMDAIRLCVQLSRLPDQVVCDELGIDKGHFSRMMKGSANFPDKKANKLMKLCGNYAPLQYEAWSNGFNLVQRASEEEITELRTRLAQLEATA